MKERRGLSKKEAQKKLVEYGPNEIREVNKASSLKIFLRQVRNNFIIYLLLTAAILSFFVGKSITAYTIIFVIVIVIATGFLQEYRAEKAVQALKQMLVPISIVIRDGQEEEIESKRIVPGDIIVVRSGERIPADAVIVEQVDLLMNESILTGESREVIKIVPKELSKYSEENMIFAGTFVANGRCIAKVVHTGMNTKFGKISELISTTEKELPLQKKVNKISKYMASVAIIFSLLTGLLMAYRSSHTEGYMVEVIITVIALSVSAFPEGLPVVLITALASGSYQMAKKNAIVNRMSVIETLGETTVICSDKTGTLTKGEMTVKKIFCNNELIDVEGAGYEATGDFKRELSKISLKSYPVLNLLLKASVLCNDSRIQRTGEDNTYHVIGAPTEAALQIAAAKAAIFKEDLKYTRLEEIPFNSSRKLMSTLCKLDNKNYVFTKGAPEVLLLKCKSVEREGGIFTLTEKQKEIILNHNTEMTSNSFRTLAVAYKPSNSRDKSSFESDLIFLGLMGMEDPPREEVKESIRTCLNAGIKVKMITGDHKDTALAIANQIGLSGKALEGSDLDKITDDELLNVVDSVVIFSRVRPEHKLRIVRALKANGEIVTMTGDGVNDSPALKEAHIGVAMGKNGTDVTRSVADLTLKDDNFATIVVAIREGRTIFKNIRKFVSYQLSCNFAELAVVFTGVLLAPLLGWEIPILLALQILFMNLVTDDIPSITLALTPSSPDIMDEKPRKSQGLLNRYIVGWVIIAGVVMAIFTLLSFYLTFNILGQNTAVARTTALVTLIVVEVAGVFNFLSFRKPVSISSFALNKYLLYAALISLAATAAIVYLPINYIFSNVPIDLSDWLVALLAGIIFITIFNVLKDSSRKLGLLDLDKF